jgi:hypothetical protein
MDRDSPALSPGVRMSTFQLVREEIFNMAEKSRLAWNKT